MIIDLDWKTMNLETWYVVFIFLVNCKRICLDAGKLSSGIAVEWPLVLKRLLPTFPLFPI